MKQKTVGTYSDGVNPYLVILVEGDDACGNRALITIGGDVSEAELFDSLLHEIQELIYIAMGLKYKPFDQQVNFGGKIMFIFDHADYCEICARVGKFMVKAWPDLLKAWKQWRKK